MRVMWIAAPSADRESLFMAVMMQAFYWDAPRVEKKEGEWWNFLAEKVEDLGKAGINALWLPPVNKASSNLSTGLRSL